LNKKNDASVPDRKLTVVDIARLAGVSGKTVSRVINRESRVSPETRERVQQIIKEIGFTPNMSARRLKSQRSFLVAMVYHSQSSSWIIDVQRCAIERSMKEGYDLITKCFSESDPDGLRSIIDLAKSGSVDGIIITPPCSSGAAVDALVELGIPLVQIEPALTDRRIPGVLSNSRQGSFDMTTYLLSLGHRRIGFIVGNPQQDSSLERLEGYRAALAHAGLKPASELIVQGDYSYPSGVTCARQLLKLSPRPTAIFAANDDMALGVMMVAGQMGITMPDQLSVAGFDDIQVASRIWPPLTTVNQPSADMAGRAVELLFEEIKKKSQSPGQHLVLPTRLILRESTAPPKTQ
jgi:LacI family transcriptional regulator